MELPIELFLGAMGIAIALAIFGFLRQPQIPAMLCFGGMFMLVFAVATDTLILNTFFEGELPANYIYRQEAGSGLIDISAGAASSDIRGEYVTNTASRLYLQEIDCIDFTLRKLGTPTGVVDVGIWDHAQAIGNPVILHFGSQDLSTVSSSVSQWYSFCLPEGTTYIIGDQDVIGVRYNAGDSLNAARIQVSTVDIFDGTNSQSTAKADATDIWSQPTGDMVMRAYLRGETSETVSSTYEFTELPKTLFALMGSIFMLCGALMVLRNN